MHEHAERCERDSAALREHGRALPEPRADHRLQRRSHTAPATYTAFQTISDDGFKSVWQMKWVNSITLPQSESIIPTTSERYSASLCWELNTKVDIKGEKGKP